MCNLDGKRNSGTKFASPEFWALSIQPKRPVCFFGNFQYQNNLRKQLTKIFEIFSRKFFIYELSLLEFLELSVEWLAFRKFNSFQNFWKLFREISVPFAVSSKGGFIIAIAFACWNLLLFLGSKTIKNFSRQIFESLG